MPGQYPAAPVVTQPEQKDPDEPPVKTTKATPVVHNLPVVNPVCTNPPCGPQPEEKDPDEPPVKTTKATPVVHNLPVVNPVCTNPPCGPQPEQKDPDEPPVKTTKATPVVHNLPVVNPVCTNPPCGPQPEQKDPDEPPVKTTKATPVVHNLPVVNPACSYPPCGPQPQQKDPDEPPVKTTKAIPVVHNLPVVNPVCANPPCGPQPEQKPDHEQPVPTDKAKPVVHGHAALTPVQPPPQDRPQDSGFGFDDATPPVCNAQGVPPASFWHDPQLSRVRMIAPAALGAVPEVGAILKAVAGFLLPDDNTPEAAFDQMRKYVDKLVPELISQEHVTQLQHHVTGLNKVLKDYNETHNPRQKGQWLTSLLALLDELEPTFFDPRVPERTLAHFVAFGSLRIAALRELALFSKDYYGNDDDRATHERWLNDTIRKYTEAAAGIKDRAMAWRLGKIHGQSQYEYHGKGADNIRVFAVDDFCNWRGPRRQRGHAGADLNQRRDQVRTAFGRELDAILEPTRHWAQGKLAEPASAGSNQKR